MYTFESEVQNTLNFFLFKSQNLNIGKVTSSQITFSVNQKIYIMPLKFQISVTIFTFIFSTQLNISFTKCF